MKKHKMKVLLLTTALALTLCGGVVLAAEGERISQDLPQEDRIALGLPDASQKAEGEATDDVLTGADTHPGTEEKSEPLPDPEGTLSFANLEERIRTGSYMARALEENIAAIEALDYEEMEEELRESINQVADQMWGAVNSGQAALEQLEQLEQNMGMNFSNEDKLIFSTSMSMSASASGMALQQAYDAQKEVFDDLRSGEFQKENADVVRELRNAQKQLIMGAETLYVQLIELEDNRAALERTLAALDRQTEELQLRYDMGQVSALTLQQLQAGRTQAASGLASLSNAQQTLLMNLKNLMGEELSGALTLTEVPVVTQEQLEAMDLEKDLAAAKEVSLTLYNAQKTLDQAKEDFEEQASDYHYDPEEYMYVQAQHVWQAAQYTYAGAVQDYELAFRTLYNQVNDYKQILEAAKTALAVEEANYQADQLKHEQGTISRNVLLTAQDDLNAAQDTVATAERNLFTAYNNYRWAVDHGILN